LEMEKATTGDMAEDAFLRINFPVKTRLRSPGQLARKRPQQNAAASPKRCSWRATV